MISMMYLLSLSSWAQSTSEDASEEIVVWGQLAVERARDDIVSQMEALGYRVSRKTDGRIVFRGEDTVTLLPSGALLFSSRGPRIIETPPETVTRDPRYQSIDPGPMSGGGLTVALPGGRKRETARDRVLDETRDEIYGYLTIVRRTELEEMLQALPERLDRLWSEGIALEPDSPVLATPEARRRAALELWATRAETPEGQRTAQAIEAWLASVVQSSETPITDAERAEFGSRRMDGRTLP